MRASACTATFTTMMRPGPGTRGPLRDRAHRLRRDRGALLLRHRLPAGIGAAPGGGEGARPAAGHAGGLEDRRGPQAHARRSTPHPGERRRGGRDGARIAAPSAVPRVRGARIRSASARTRTSHDAGPVPFAGTRRRFQGGAGSPEWPNSEERHTTAAYLRSLRAWPRIAGTSRQARCSSPAPHALAVAATHRERSAGSAGSPARPRPGSITRRLRLARRATARGTCRARRGRARRPAQPTDAPNGSAPARPPDRAVDEARSCPTPASAL